MRKKILFILLLCILLAACAVFIWLRTGRIESTVALVGGEQMLVTTDVSGVVTELHVQPGDQVPAGAVLLSLDTSARRAAPATEDPEQRLAAAEEAEIQAREQVEQLSVAQAQARFERRKLDLQSPRPSQEHIAAALEREKTNDAALAAAQDRLEQASAARAELSRPPVADTETTADAPEESAKARITAPAEGIVRLVEAKIGEPLSAGSIAVRMEPLDAEGFWVSALFAEADAQRIRPGMPCRVRIEGDAAGEEWRGVVAAFADHEEADSENSALPVRIRLLPETQEGQNTMKALPDIGKKAWVVVDAHLPRISVDTHE